MAGTGGMLPDLSEMPAIPPPPGQSSNFVNPPSQQQPMVGVSTVFMVITALAVGARLYHVSLVSRTRGYEDRKLSVQRE